MKVGASHTALRLFHVYSGRRSAAPAKKQHSVLFVIAMAAALSVVFRYCLPMVSDGFAIIISAVAASAAAAFIFPVKDEEAEE